MLIHTKYVEKINEEKQGKELYFEEIPTKEEREQLKANGYKWNNNKKCWYIKLGIKTQSKIKTKIDIAGINLKEFAELTEQEKQDFVNTVWGWGGDKWKNEQLKKHYFFKTKDNFIIAIENEKYFSISKDLWFDDELPIPAKSKRLFVDYNTSLHARSIDNCQYFVIIQAYYGKHENVINIKPIQYTCDYLQEKIQNYYKRDLTEAEKQEYSKIINVINCKYIERLSKYFDKYGQNNVFCRGYWVNR